MRPFSTFGLIPFLGTTPECHDEIRRAFVKLSREHHPDLFANALPSARAEHEAELAKINVDYKLLIDPLALLTKVIGEASDKGRKTPHQLALEYFELQEENTPTKMIDFANKVKALTISVEKKLFQAAARFPYKGTGDSNQVPWSNTDLEKIRPLLDEHRTLLRLTIDINTKFENQNANSN
jgi:hypothetical protein